MRPFIKWEGGKFKHLKHIYPYIPNNYNTYIEPFVGSGSLFLKVQPDKWIINDINEILIILWKLVQSNPEVIIKKIKSFSKLFNKKTNHERLTLCRRLTENMNENDFNKTESALVLLIMKSIVFMGYLFVKNKYSFSSLNFFNDQKVFPNNNQVYFERLISIHEYLNRTTGKILCTDYKKILKLAKKNDFVFLDPPYIEDHIYQFSYNKNEAIDTIFNQELLKELQKLDKIGVFWLMTQADTLQIRELFKEYIIIEFPVYRRMQKKYKNELLIKNF